MVLDEEMELHYNINIYLNTDIDATIGRLWQKEVDRRKVGGGEEEGEGEAGSELVVDSNCSSESEGNKMFSWAP